MVARIRGDYRLVEFGEAPSSNFELFYHRVSVEYSWGVEYDEIDTEWRIHS